MTNYEQTANDERRTGFERGAPNGSLVVPRSSLRTSFDARRSSLAAARVIQRSSFRSSFVARRS